LAIQVEVEIGKGPRVAIEERGRLASDDAIELGNALLTVKDQLDRAAG